MTKIAILTDTHFGIRNGSDIYHAYFKKFYDNIFFPTLERHSIKEVLHGGDMFDKRKHIDFKTLDAAKSYFFDRLAEKQIQVFSIVGNHDDYYKHTNAINSQTLLLEDSYPNFHILKNPCEVQVGGIWITMIPWINNENYEKTMQTIQLSTSKVVLGHLEVNGSQVFKGIECTEGLDSNIFSDFDLVMSGHFHTPSQNGNIRYLGSPYQMYWNDFEDQRGFYIFDTETLELEMIRNPYTLFHKIIYRDDFRVHSNVDVSYLQDTYVKIVIEKKGNAYQFDKFVEKIAAANPAQLQIIDNEQLIAQISEDMDLLDEAEDTLTTMYNYVDHMGQNVDTRDLKNLLASLYTEAQSVGTQ